MALTAGLLAWRALPPGTPRRHAWLELALLLGVLGIALLTPPFDAGGAANAPLADVVDRHLGGSVCLYRHLTGIECPGCGLTRSFVQLAHGHVGNAVLLNPLGPVLFALLLWGLAGRVTRLLVGRELEVALPPRVEWRLWGLLAAGFFTLGMVRIAVTVL